jgi:hypothetical protein
MCFILSVHDHDGDKDSGRQRPKGHAVSPLGALCLGYQVSQRALTFSLDDKTPACACAPSGAVTGRPDSHKPSPKV